MLWLKKAKKRERERKRKKEKGKEKRKKVPSITFHRFSIRFDSCVCCLTFFAASGEFLPHPSVARCRRTRSACALECELRVAANALCDAQSVPRAALAHVQRRPAAVRPHRSTPAPTRKQLVAEEDIRCGG